MTIIAHQGKRSGITAISRWTMSQMVSQPMIVCQDYSKITIVIIIIDTVIDQDDYLETGIESTCTRTHIDSALTRYSSWSKNLSTIYKQWGAGNRG